MNVLHPSPSPARGRGLGEGIRAPLLRPAWLPVCLVLALALAAGCARPYRGSKTLGALGIGVLASSAALWVAGERGDRASLTKVGAVGSAAGAALVVGAGAWLAASATCNVDPDCPDDEVCREIPAPPGREPYRQCTPR